MHVMTSHLEHVGRGSAGEVERLGHVHLGVVVAHVAVDHYSLRCALTTSNVPPCTCVSTEWVQTYMYIVLVKTTQRHLPRTCSPMSSTALDCLEIVWIKNVVLTLSTLGTRMEEYSGVLSVG